MTTALAFPKFHAISLLANGFDFIFISGMISKNILADDKKILKIVYLSFTEVCSPLYCLQGTIGSMFSVRLLYLDVLHALYLGLRTCGSRVTCGSLKKYLGLSINRDKWKYPELKRLFVELFKGRL